MTRPRSQSGPSSLSLSKKKPVKEKEPFVASGIRQQGFFLPLIFPSLNEYTRAASQTYGSIGHRGTAAADIKKKMERTIRLQIRLSKLVPMEAVYFFLTYYEVGRNRNKDNISATSKKFIFDALQDQGILRNDGWKEIVGWSERFIAGARIPGVHVTMYDPHHSEETIVKDATNEIHGSFFDWKRLVKEISR